MLNKEELIKHNLSQYSAKVNDTIKLTKRIEAILDDGCKSFDGALLVQKLKAERQILINELRGSFALA